MTGSGSERSVDITALSVEITAEGETLAGRFADGCFIGTVPGEPEEINFCELQQELEDELELDDVVEDPEAVEDAIADIQAAFADYENPGIIVKEVDGAWYVSPMATASDQVLAVMEALSREEIESLGDQITELVETFEDEVAGTGFDVPELDDFELPAEDELSVPTTGPEAIEPDDTIAPDATVMATEDTAVTDSTYVDEECFELDAANAGSVLPGARRRRPDRRQHDAVVLPLRRVRRRRDDLGRRLLLAARRGVRRPGRGVAALRAGAHRGRRGRGLRVRRGRQAASAWRAATRTWSR